MKEITDIRELQEIEFDILCDIARFCRENGIRYFLCGGTLLGAIRHKGFIPWDDDVDIGMLRPDYERFLETYKSDHNELWWHGNKSGYFSPFAKLGFCPPKPPPTSHESDSICVPTSTAATAPAP